jgi:serine/threonine-protein phosphatase 6 regulatory ankyrin repeat subunit B
MRIKYYVSIFTLFCLFSLTLVSKTANPSVTAESPRHPDYQLLVKSLQGNTAAVNNLLRDGADPDTAPGPNDKGMTALMFAAWNGHREIVNSLAQEGANLNATSDLAMTALMYAAFNGHTQSVQLLLSKNANPNIQATRGRTALMYAIERGHAEAVRILAEASNTSQRNAEGDTPLQTAVKGDNAQVVKALLRANPLLEETDNFQQTPLMNAARKGSTVIVLNLLNKGANVNARDSNGKTALVKALIGNHRAVVQVLRARGGTL